MTKFRNTRMSLGSAEFNYIRQLVNNHSAIALDESKEYLVEMRLAAVIRKLGIASLSELVLKLQSGTDDKLRLLVGEAMTTNETSFFRDIHPFETLKNDVLPDLFKRRQAERTLSIWCAASSSGQEPYSIAMILRDHFPEILGWKLNFLATDISEHVLTQAREGRYNQLEVNRGLSTSHLTNHFQADGRQWVVNSQLRKMIRFESMNLNERWLPMPLLDLVFIRNVLIYFGVDTRKKILERIGGMMRPDGYLFVGASETPLNLVSNFEKFPVGKTVCYRMAAT